MQKVYKETLKFIEKNDFKDKKWGGDFFHLLSWKSQELQRRNQKIRQRSDFGKKSPRSPVAAEAFGGRMKIPGRVVSDDRDINKVRAWADELGKKRARQIGSTTCSIFHRA